ncbi:LysM peptidoglycan-binding domain-containing protein [Pseudomarimonas arenosa]|uniref:LysM peptidoglycan-binding domain-containing protein n=1 Tax=Pseudomarimonas arenosa TaxID=2774145 RepID=A0AAW3ZGH6_9GAMM|nr:LysM domain-containing protein [Pseudomarimonas arenosa]MBD8525213.1 LysM peptidoglycan-binding domain-containing protein [Pseudomarimonas arenosa]
MFKKLLTFAAAFALTVSGYVAAVELRADHPDTYVVKKGDTLWDIAKRFLSEPWLWPEIWQANPQIENPHLIYPGDEISLAYLSGRPVLNVKKLSPEVRREKLDAIQTVPLADIESFLRRYHIMSEEEKDALPYVLGVEEGRLYGTSGYMVYARGGNLQEGDKVAIARPTVRYAKHPHPHTGYPRLRRDEWTMQHGLRPKPSGMEWAYYAASDNGFEVLGWELVELTEGTVTRSGDPSSILLSAQGVEVQKGDVILPKNEHPFDLTFMPHAPRSIPEHLRIMAMTDRVQYGGRNDVIALSAGSEDGIDNGTVFSIYSPGEVVRDEVRHKQRLVSSMPSRKVELPADFVGHAMVFKTFDKVSYALIMDGIRPAQLEDELRAPVRLQQVAQR